VLHSGVRDDVMSMFQIYPCSLTSLNLEDMFMSLPTHEKYDVEANTMIISAMW
jgi:hypothetical protein